MAIKQEAAALTEEHRLSQLRLRSAALRDYLRIWPLWRGDQASFAQLTAATTPLVASYHQVSATLAGSYFEAFRSAEEISGQAAAQLASEVNQDQLAAGMYVTGRQMTSEALLAGKSPAETMRAAFVRTSGVVGNQVLDGGRQTLLDSISGDKAAIGWQRVASGNPCAFCLMLCSRGPAYSESSVDFQAHIHCACSAEPMYEGSHWTPQAQSARELWNRAQEDAGHPGGGEALNAFRRALVAN